MHPIKAKGTWSAAWQSGLSDAYICDHLASRLAVFVVPQDYAPPALVNEDRNDHLPTGLFDAAVVHDVLGLDLT